TDAYADVAGACARVALSHVRSALDVASEDVLETAVRLHGLIERVDRRTGQPEDVRYAFLLENLNCGLGRRHPRHCQSSLRAWLIARPDRRSTPRKSAE